MKTTAILSLFLIYAMSVTAQSHDHDLVFSNGDRDKLKVTEDDPGMMSRNMLSFSPFSAGLGLADHGYGIFGPVALNAGFTRTLDERNKKLVNINLLYVPLEAGFLRNRPGEKMLRITLGASYSHGISDKLSTTLKEFNLSDMKYAGGFREVIYRTEIPVQLRQVISLRGSGVFYQRSGHPLEVQANGQLPGNAYRYFGTRGGAIGAGISYSRYRNFRFESKKFGPLAYYLAGSIYLDLLVAPIHRNYGTIREGSRLTRRGALSEFNHGSAILPGFRFGIQRNRCWGSGTLKGMILGLETGMLPGYKTGGGYVTVKAGRCWQ